MTKEQLDDATKVLAMLRGDFRTTDEQLRQEIKELYQALKAIDYVLNRTIPT
jgi:prefoldin subunit 5|tara:strand:- start:506 stop:661 length:156 start_codon:yes stop_codon:yes gene_type:complete